jgi:hypothetical protein
MRLPNNRWFALKFFPATYVHPKKEKNVFNSSWGIYGLGGHHMVILVVGIRLNGEVLEKGKMTMLDFRWDKNSGTSI